MTERSGEPEMKPPSTLESNALLHDDPAKVDGGPNTNDERPHDVLTGEHESDWATPAGVSLGVRIFASLLLAIGAAVLLIGVWRFDLRTGWPDSGDHDQWAWMVAGVVLTLCGGAMLVFRADLGDGRRLIQTSTVVSLILLIALGVLWALIDSSTKQSEWQGNPVQNPAQTDAYLDRFDNLVPALAPELRIPTGVLLQSVQFLSGSDVKVTGYLWQKYRDAIPDTITRGFVLPEALNEAYSAQEVYRSRTGDVETIGWYFAATLRQNFAYDRYPFDRPNVWLRLWARDFERNVVLVPDFASYENMDPNALPGIERTFVFGEWRPVYSGFSFLASSYNTDFGLASTPEDTAYPDLYFNFVLKRDPLGPFTEHIVYGVTVALIIFGLLVLTSNDPDQRVRFGISTAGVLGSVSVLLFGVITKQNSIRTGLGAQQLTYLEVIPTALYVLLIGVALNAILVAAPFDIKVLGYRNNLLPDLVYWPLLLGSLFVVTMLLFFGS